MKYRCNACHEFVETSVVADGFRHSETCDGLLSPAPIFPEEIMSDSNYREMEGLRKELDAAVKEALRFRRETERLRNMLDNAKKLGREAMKIKDAEIGRLEKERDHWKHRVDSEHEVSESLKEDNFKQFGELAEAEGKIEQLEKQRAVEAKENERLRGELNLVPDDLQAAVTEIERLKKQADEACGAASDLIHRKDAVINGQQERIETLTQESKSEIKQLRRELEEADEEIERLRFELFEIAQVPCANLKIEVQDTGHRHEVARTCKDMPDVEVPCVMCRAARALEGK